VEVGMPESTNVLDFEACVPRAFSGVPRPTESRRRDASDVVASCETARSTSSTDGRRRRTAPLRARARFLRERRGLVQQTIAPARMLLRRVFESAGASSATRGETAESNSPPPAPSIARTRRELESDPRHRRSAGGRRVPDRDRGYEQKRLLHVVSLSPTVARGREGERSPRGIAARRNRRGFPSR
jgi:hypothetical protein